MTNPYAEPFLLVNGRRIAADEAGQWVDVVNPCTGETIGRTPLANPDLIEEALQGSGHGFEIWRKTSPAERKAIMARAATILRRDIDHYAACMTMEQGKPIAESRGELESGATLLEWSPDAAEIDTKRPLPDRAGFAALAVRKEPIGPVAAFSPWNYPSSIAARKVASALAVGCSIVVKPAEETPMAFLAVAAALDEAGLPPGVLNVLFGDPPALSRQIIASPIIRKVAFTGSTQVGMELAALAGAAAKPTVMELGGHAAVVVCDDADIDAVVAQAVIAKTRNAGQICICPTRYFVQSGVYDRFVEQFAAGLAAVKVGNGLELDTRMGPLANARRVTAVDRLIQDAVADGAVLVTGGKRPDGPGNFYAPTLLKDVPDTAEIMQAEPFGPVALVIPFTSLDDAIARANNTSYALAAYGFTRSDATAERLASELDAGMVGINSFSVVFIDSPIGGRRMSGFGSEGGPEGLDAFRINKFVSLA